MKLALSHIVATLMVLCAVVLHVMADNPDAPNLDFSHGNFDNWRLYVGDYEASAPTSDVYNYTWTHISPASAYVTNAQRMMLINAVDQNDPIVSCSDFYTNPFAGSIVTRIGVPLTTEGMPSASGGCQNRWNLYRAAAAEKMTYTYTVTEGSSILRYDFAAVLNVPDNSNHSGEQLPYFGIKVEVNDAATGSSYVVPCGSYETNANESTSSLLHNKPIEECRSSRAGASAGNYVYRPWTNGTIDLRDYVGKSVTITIITHDCIVQCGNYNVAGGHESYAYFRANATSVGLQTSNCGIDDGIITAPAGYASYTWSRSDGLDATGIIYDPARPNQIKVPRSTIREGVVYKCVLSDEMGCAHIEITTKLDPVLLTPGFEYENHCGGEVKFTDNTTVSGDVVTRWQWDFGDGDYSFDTNPMHSYTTVGDYDVKLIVQTEKGCSATVTKKVRVRFFPSLAITASSPVCKGSEFLLSVNGAEAGSTYRWFTSTSPVLSEQGSFMAVAENSETYYVEVTDAHNCKYQASQNITVQIPSQVTIEGDDMVCPGGSTVLTASGAASYEWEGIPGNDPQISVSPNVARTYKVTGTDHAGCKTVATHTVGVRERPVVTIEGDEEMCAGGSVVWTPTGAERYYWNDYNYNAPRTFDKADTYAVTGFDVYGCESQPVYKTLSENPLPEITVNGALTACPDAQYVVNLSSSVPGTQFSWNDGYSGAARDLPATSDMAFSIEAETPKGCKSSTNVFLEQKPVPYVQIGGLTEVCSKTPVQLIASATGNNTTYHWSHGDVGAETTVTPTQTTTYKVIAIAENGCKAEDSHTIEAFPLPVVSITGKSEVCRGDTLHIHAAGNASYYIWQGDSPFEGKDNIIEPDETTVYTVKAVSEHTCESVVSKRIEVKDVPDVTLTGVTQLCKGSGYFSLKATGAADSYLWHDGSTSQNFVHEADADIDAWVIATRNGCQMKYEQPLTAFEIPKLRVSQDKSEICVGESAHLSVVGADSYKWLNTSFSEPDIDVTPLVTTVYRVKGYSDEGCESDVAQLSVTVNQQPQVSISGDEYVCYGTKATLHAEGDGETFQWSTGEQGPQIEPVINNEITISLTAYSVHGCERTANFTVTPVSPPALSVHGKTQGCIGEELTLVGEGASTYLWDDDGSTGAEHKVTVEQNTNIRLTGTHKNCSNSIVIPITATLSPNLIVTSDTIVCAGADFKLSAAGAESYEWNTGDTGESVTLNINSPTTYFVKGVTGGCASTKQINVDLLPSPVLKLRLEDYGVCPYRDDSVMVSVSGAKRYDWYSKPADDKIASSHSSLLRAGIDGSTWIYAMGYNEYECVSVDSIEIKDLPQPEFTYRVEPTWIDDTNSDVRLTGMEPSDNAVWYWNTGDGTQLLDGKEVTHSYDVDVLADMFTVTVTAVDRHNCKFTADVPIYVWKDVWAPTAFTPNGDGLNDTFHFYGGDYVQEFTFYIYNRLGEIVFEGSSTADEWDGMYQGKLCPWGVYGWVANFKSNIDGMERSGELKGKVSIVK